MTPEAMVNKVVAFWPLGTVEKGVPKAKPLIGQVLSIACYTLKFGPGDIPEVKIRVKGRSGKEMIIGVTETYAQFYDSWNEALAVHQ